MLGFRCYGGCNGGCGETYWGDWCSDPPCNDPCDRCGNYIGPPAAYDPPTPYVDEGYAKASHPRPTTTVAKRKAPVRPAAQIVSEPQIISETDEVVDPAEVREQWQAKAVQRRSAR